MSATLLPVLPEAMEQPLAELDAMRRMLEASRGTFSLSIAVCTSQALRDYLIRRLTDDHPGIHVISIPAETGDPYGFVRSRLGATQPDAVFIADLERSIPSEETRQSSLRSLNASRELWENRFRCPIVFWLPEYAATLLSVNARDFWRYCSHRFSFVFHSNLPGPSAADRISGDLVAASNLSRDEKHFRIAELQQRLADTDSAPDSTMARHRLLWLNELGWLHYIFGEAGEAQRSWLEYSTLASKAGSKSDVATALGNLGLASAALGDARGAIEFHERACAASREIGDRRGEGAELNELGNSRMALGEPGKAIGYYEQSLILARNLGDRAGEGTALGNLGNAWIALGDARKALGYHEQALTLSRQIGDRRGEGQDLGNLGNAWAALGDTRKAVGYYERQTAIAREIGDRAGEGRALGNLGSAWADIGDSAKAIGYYNQHLTIARETGDRRGEATALFNSAVGLDALHDSPQALDRAEQAARIFASIESPHAEAASQFAARLRGREIKASSD
jgi:tetratricopeptide (TPR) repeat protein